jgi:hypothetical protein
MKEEATKRKHIQKEMLEKFTRTDFKDLIEKLDKNLKRTSIELEIIEMLFNYKNKFVVVDNSEKEDELV